MLFFQAALTPLFKGEEKINFRCCVLQVPVADLELGLSCCVTSVPAS